MGKGDSKTRRGKIFKGSYGNARPKTKGEATKVDNQEKAKKK
ncbi:MAG: 30S ribosomal protein THX [Bdellovibrionota bacterium]